MKTLEAQNHYEVLEVGRSARPDEIERAYRMAKSTWAEGSLALYSIFDDSNAEAVRERIGHAYRVLGDEEARQAYDAATFDSPPEPEETPEVLSADALGEDTDDMQAALDGRLGGALDGGEQGDEFDGARLRRARMHRGIEIDHIADVTKVSATYLRGLEEEAFDHLPATVYVRGFVTAYARVIGLDPERVAASYMARLEESRKEKSHGRLLGRS